MSDVATKSVPYIPSEDALFSSSHLCDRRCCRNWRGLITVFMAGLVVSHPAFMRVLNSGPGSQDDPANVAENRRRIASHIGVSSDRLLSAYQVHGADALMVDGPFAR
jgi:polyphenol oxidase